MVKENFIINIISVSDVYILDQKSIAVPFDHINFKEYNQILYIKIRKKGI